jgi:hypothetical protein
VARNQFGMRVDGGNVRRAKRALAAAIVGGLCLLGALNAAAESNSLAPQTPEVVVKHASSTGLLFTWSPVDRAAGYDVYLGTLHVGLTTYTRADFQNLVCNTRYVLRVVAFDGAGRRSTPSLVNAQTSACASGSSAGGDSSQKPPPPPVKPPPPGSPPPPPSGPPSGPPPPPGASLMVAPNGSDKNSCAAAAPCATFDRAYHQASPGTAVLVAAGSYPQQAITVDARKTGAAADVVFQPAAGAVRVSGVSIAGSHVELRNMQTKWAVQSGANGVTLRNVVADGAVSISGASNVSVLGGQVYSPVPVSADPVIASVHGQVPTNILIDGVYFHDFVDVGPGQLHHIECLQVGGAINLTIRNSTFRNCGTHDIFIRSWGTINGSPYPLTNIVIQNNSLAATVAGYYAMQILDDLWTASPTSFSVLNNTAAQGILVRVTHGTAQVAGNVMAAGAVPGTSVTPTQTPLSTGTLRTRGIG